MTHDVFVPQQSLRLLVPFSRQLRCEISLFELAAVAAPALTYKPYRISGRKKINGWVHITLTHKASTRLMES